MQHKGEIVEKGELLMEGSPSLGDILTSKNNCISKQFSRFVDIKSSQQLLFSVDTIKSMEYHDKRELHEKFFMEYHFDLFKGELDKIFEAKVNN